MHDAEILKFEGPAGSQPPRADAAASASGPQSASKSTAVLPVLLTDKQAAELWGIGLTLFHELRATGAEWFPAARQLSPKVVRYVRAEVEQAALNMPRQGKPQEPAQLRRGRIERAKRDGVLA